MLAEEQNRLHLVPLVPHTVAFGLTRTVASKTPMVAFDEPRPRNLPELFGAARGRFNHSPTLFIGPSRFGTLEVIAIVTPPTDVHIFHVMPPRESTRKSVDYEEGDQS